MIEPVGGHAIGAGRVNILPLVAVVILHLPRSRQFHGNVGCGVVAASVSASPFAPVNLRRGDLLRRIEIVLHPFLGAALPGPREQGSHGILRALRLRLIVERGRRGAAPAPASGVARCRTTSSPPRRPPRTPRAPATPR